MVSVSDSGMCLTVDSLSTMLGARWLLMRKGGEVTRKYWWIALLCWMGLIFLASSSLFAWQMSAEGTEELFGSLNYWVRKSAHMGVYAVLMYLWFRSLWTDSKRFWPCLVWSVVFSVLYGISDEYHQDWIPERSGKWSDVGWDTVGVMMMGGTFFWVRARGGVAWQVRLFGCKIN